MPKATVIIVNWNGKKVLGECLESLDRQTWRDFETIVVDNGSGDGSVEFLRQRHPRVRVIPLDTNTGFAAGNNAALPVASGEYLVTLNNDTVADDRFLEQLVAAAEKRPDVGMVAPRICSHDDPDIVDSTGILICRDGMSRGANRGRRFSSLAFAPVEEILCPSACAALYRRAMIDDIGFFDETFFAYCEDTDLGLRGRRAGWGAVFVRDAVIYHKYSQTSGSFSPFKLYLVERNHYRVALKNFPLRWLAALPFWTLVRYLVQVKVVLAGSGSGREFLAGSRAAALAALARGIRDAALGTPQAFAARTASRLSAAALARLLLSYQLTFRKLLDADE